MYAVGPSMMDVDVLDSDLVGGDLDEVVFGDEDSAAAVGDIAAEVVHLSGVDVGVSCGDDEGFVLNAVEHAGEELLVAFGWHVGGLLSLSFLGHPRVPL